MRKRRLAKGLRAAAAVGLTSVHDAGVDVDTIPLYKELLAEDALPVRVHVMLRGPGEFLEKGASLVPEHGLGDGRLNIHAIKVVADGALGSRGAWLLEPYADEPGTRGLNTVDAAAFERLLGEAVRRGFQVATHAIGDAANRFVLDAYERAFAGRDGAALRFRVEHAQVLAPSDVPRFKRLGVLPSMQPTHCTSDMYWAADRVGPERVKGAYLWYTFLDAGVRVPAGSDAPVERIDVMPGLAGGGDPPGREGLAARRLAAAGAREPGAGAADVHAGRRVRRVRREGPRRDRARDARGPHRARCRPGEDRAVRAGERARAADDRRRPGRARGALIPCAPR